MAKLRWGILTAGHIARKMAQTLNGMDDAELVAVGARSQSSADVFGEEFGIPKRYGSYEALAADPDIDVIYVASPHSHHHEHTLLCLNHGKHVLCEKAFSQNAAQAEEMVNLARQKGLFLMEAYWTRFLPAIAQLRAWIAEGRIGDVQMVEASFCVRLPFDPQKRIFNPALAGGALLDVGIYPVSFVVMVLGLPDRVQSTAYLGETGVDEHESMIFSYGDGRMASLMSSVTLHGPFNASVMGTEGTIFLPTGWNGAQSVTLKVHDAEPETVNLPFDINGFEYQVAEVHACIEQGKLESAIMPMDESVAIMRLMDELRAEWGLRYPNE